MSRIFASFFAFLLLSLSSLSTVAAQSLAPGQTVEDLQADVLDDYDFQDLASASEVIGNNAYRLFFATPSYDNQWRQMNSSYRLLLALSQDPDDRGQAGLLASVLALNGNRKDQAEILAMAALSKVQRDIDRSLALFVLDRAAGRTEKRFSRDHDNHIWALARTVGPFGPYRGTTAQEGEFARLCLRFSHPIEASHRVDYRDLIDVRPAPKVTRFTVLDGGHQLCLVGAEFERTYDMTVRQGLKNRAGLALRQDVSFSLTTPSRQPEMRLPGQGYMLPASGPQLVPLETVNYDALHVGLYHLDERNIAQVLRQGVLAQSAYDITDPRDVYEYIEDRTGTFKDRVSPVFEGRVSLEKLRHERREDGLSIADMIQGPAERGLYLLTVASNDQEDPGALKWLMVSDLALTTVDTPQGLAVSAINSTTGGALSEDVTVTMVTRGNRVMKPARSMDNVTAFFDAAQLKGKNADEPLYIFASHPELGHAFLALGRAPIAIESTEGLPDLKSEPLSLYLSADRGQFREGETAHVFGLLQNRDQDAGFAVDSLFAWLRDPQGETVETFEVSLSTANGFEAAVDLPFGARQGRWSLSFALGQGLDPLGSLSLQVADFVPPSVEIELQPVADLRFDGTDTIEVQVDYLFGAPAKNLSVSLAGTLSKVPTLDGYSIGLQQEEFVFARPFDLFAKTDEAGRAVFDIPAFALPDQTSLSLVGVEAVVTDAAGREERTSGRAKIANDQTFVGLKPLFDDNRPVSENSTQTFEVALLNASAEAVDGAASWVLYREHYDYSWYFDGGRWNYESSYIDLPVSQGELSATRDLPAQVSVDVDWGAYRLEVVSKDGLAASSFRFNAGWRALPQIDRAPDRLGVTLATKAPRPGDLIDFVIDSPFEGQALAYLVGSETQVIDLGTLSQGDNSLSLTLPETWSDIEGLWLLPVLYSHGAVGVADLPSRAVGSAFVSFDHSDLVLPLTVEVEPVVKPRETLSVPISVGALAEGEEAFALAWLVDDGVLRMTGFQSPDAAPHFLDPFALPADLRDTFASLISSAGLQAAALKQGYDGEAFADLSMARAAPFSLAQGLTTRIKETLALSSDIQAIQADGTATLEFDVPDFVGRGRLMVMSWSSKGRLGAKAQNLSIRDPLVADLFLPRFLAPQDEMQVKLLITNTEDLTLDADVTLHLGQGLSLIEGARRSVLSMNAKGQTTLPLRLKAGDFVGATDIRVEIASGTESISRTFPIEVRAAATRVVERRSFLLQDGETFELGANLLADFDNPSIQMSVAPANALDSAGLAQSLAAYPFRCTEQTTSRALGLLLGDQLDMSEDQRSTDLHQALVTLQNRRGSGGLVGLWSGRSEGNLFLQAYASDFLSHAARQNVAGADAAYDAFIGRLAQGLKRLQDPYYADEVSLRTQAYALAVLAHAGKPNIAAQRLLFDRLQEQDSDVFAKAALAVAAQAAGDTPDRDHLLNSLLKQAGPIQDGEIQDFGSGLRNTLAALALLAEANLINDGPGLAFLEQTLPRLSPLMTTKRLTTQEQAWALRLADHLGAAPGTFLNLEGEVWDIDYRPMLSAQDFGTGQSIENIGGDPLMVSLWQAGTPSLPVSGVSEGLIINRFMFDLETLQPVENPNPGQRVLVALMGAAFTDAPLDYVLADLLPAGFEVEQTGLPTSVRQYGGRVGQCREGENGLTPGICQVKGEKAFQVSPSDLSEARADRVLFGFEASRGSFAHYYVMRRTQAGTVTQPGAFVEAMYAPDIRARSASTLIQ